MRTRRTIAAIALLLAVAACTDPTAPVTVDTSLRVRFADPPADARPRTLWYWMNGNVTADGITRDLEAMRAVGLSGAVIFDGGIDASPRIATYDSPAVPAGYDFDLVNAEILLNNTRVIDGAIVLDSGTSYRVLVVPDQVDALTPELAARLRDLVRSGMVLLAPRPTRSLGLRNSADAELVFAAAVDEVWGADAVPAAGRRVGDGRVFSAVPIQSVLDAIDVPPDVTCVTERPGGQVAWLHRESRERDIYFIANRQRRQERVACSFRIARRAPRLWRATDGSTTGAAVFADSGERTVVDLDLGPADSLFVVFDRSGPLAAPITWAEHDGVRFAEAALPAPPTPAAPAASFTVSVWAKPEVELRVMPEESITGRADETGKSYVIPARPGDELYGDGHAAMALAIGRNGVVLLERTSHSVHAVLVAHVPTAGWTHFAVVYDDGTPSLYVNGEHVRTGLRSGNVVHPGGAAEPAPSG